MSPCNPFNSHSIERLDSHLSWSLRKVLSDLCGVLHLSSRHPASVWSSMQPQAMELSSSGANLSPFVASVSLCWHLKIDLVTCLWGSCTCPLQFVLSLQLSETVSVDAVLCYRKGMFPHTLKKPPTHLHQSRTSKAALAFPEIDPERLLKWTYPAYYRPGDRYSWDGNTKRGEETAVLTNNYG